MVRGFYVLANLDQLVEAAKGAVRGANVGLGERGRQLQLSATSAGQAALQVPGCLT